MGQIVDASGNITDDGQKSPFSSISQTPTGTHTVYALGPNGNPIGYVSQAEAQAAFGGDSAGGGWTGNQSKGLYTSDPGTIQKATSTYKPGFMDQYGFLLPFAGPAAIAASGAGALAGAAGAGGAGAAEGAGLVGDAISGFTSDAAATGVGAAGGAAGGGDLLSGFQNPFSGGGTDLVGDASGAQGALAGGDPIMGTGATGNLATAVAPTAGAVSPFAGGDPIMGTGGSGELATPAGAGVNPLAGGDPIMGTGASGELATPGSPAAGGVAVPAVGTSTGGGELAGGGLAEAGNAAANLSAFSSPSVDFSALDVNPSGAAGFDAGGGGSFSGAGSVPSGGSGMPGYFEGDSSGALGDVSSINDPDAIAKAAAAAGGGSSTPTTAGTGVLQSILDGAKKNPLAVGAFAANLLAQLKANKSGTGTADQLKALGQPTQDIATDLLAQYKSDTLNPSSQQAIDAWKQQQTASIKNYYAKAGIPDSTAAKHAIADIEAKAVAMADLARQGLLDEGLKVAGVAQGPLTAAIAQQARQDTALSTASSSALNSLMTLLTLQNKTPTATPAA